MENIIPAIITGVLALVGVIITNISSNKTIENKLSIAQAVTDTKLDNLTDEVKKHNNFAVEIPVMKEQIKSMDRRLSDLERSNNDNK
jgi:Tfp pilus assembly protein PilO